MNGIVVMIRGDGSVEVELDVAADTVPEGTTFEVYRLNPNCPCPELQPRDAFIISGRGVAKYLRAPGKRAKWPNRLNIVPPDGGDPFDNPQVGDLVRPTS